MANKLRTDSRGRPIIGRNGLPVLAAVGSAPNGVDLLETVEIVDGTSGKSVTFQTENLTAGYANLMIIWHGEDEDGEPLTSAYQFPAAVGTIPGGTAALGAFGERGLTPTHWQIAIQDTSGNWGFPPLRKALSPEVALLAVTVNPVLAGPQTEGADIVFTPPVWTGDEDVTLSYVTMMAEDTSGTNPDTAEDATGKVPNIDAPLDSFRLGAVFAGPGTAGLEGPYWSDWIGITATVVTTPVTLDDAAIVASQRLAVDGVTLAGFDPGDVLTAGAASATIVAYVATDSTSGTLFLGPITGGPIADNTAVTCTGGAAVANGASTAYPLTAGAAYYVLPPTFNGTPTSNVPIEQIASDSAGTGAATQELSGSFPPYLGTKYWRYGRTVTGYGITGSSTFYTAWMPIGIPTLAKIADDQWPVINTTPVNTTETRLVSLYLLASLGASKVYWTTSTSAQLDANPFPVGRELMTLSDPVTYEGATYQVWLFNAALNDAGTKDFRDFGTSAAELQRASRLGVIAEIGGALTPISDRKTVPDLYVAPTRQHVRMIMRTEGQYDVGEPGGTGMQFPRAYDVDGDFVWMGYDVCYPSVSTDFGDNWESDPYPGLYAAESFTGGRCDGKFVHCQVSSKALSGNYDLKQGIYRLDKDTGQYTQTLALADVYGSNNGSMRLQLHYVDTVPGSGTGPDTRTVYTIHGPSANGTFTTIQVYKSTNGGASYATEGGTLAVATYGGPLGIHCTSNALYLRTLTGLWRRPQNSTTWTKVTGLPNNTAVHNVEFRGTQVRAYVKGAGYYVATDATTPAFTQKYAYNLNFGASSPANANRITLCGAANVVPKWSWDGGTTFGNVVTQKFPGQFNEFEHKIHANQAWFAWHDTDPDVVIAMRYHHMGKSTDGGKTFYWSSRGFDYSGVKNCAFHPTDWRRVLFASTDRILFYTPNGGEFVTDDAVSGTVKDDIDTELGETPSAYTSAGALILVNGAHMGIVANVGVRDNRTPMVTTRLVTTTETDEAATGNGNISVTASPDLPAGMYTFTCTAAVANGGTFSGVAPLGVSMGNWTVGTAKTYTHPWGGTLAVTISDGSVDHTAGANPKVFSVYVNPLGAHDVLSRGIQNSGWAGEANPTTPSTGCSGRFKWSMNSSGVVAKGAQLTYDFLGYGGTAGTVIYGHVGNSTIWRSTNEGTSWGASAWWSGGTGAANSFEGVDAKAVCCSRHDDARVYIGTRAGTVRKLQAGVSTTVFDFDAWCDAEGVTTPFGGATLVGGRYVPIITGVGESFFDPNLVYCVTYIYGARFMMFRTKNALAATPVWENITLDGFMGPATGMRIHPLTDEPLVFSRHGTTVFRVDAAHRETYSIANSLGDTILAGRGTYSYIGV